MTRRIHILALAALPLAAQPPDPTVPTPYIPPTVVVQGPLPSDANPNPNFGPGMFNGTPGQPAVPPDVLRQLQAITGGSSAIAPQFTPAPAAPPAPARAPEPALSESTYSRLQQTIESLEVQVATLRQMLSRASGAGSPTQLAITAFRRGRELADQRLHRAAIDAFSEAILLDPGNDSAFLLRGDAYQRLGDFASADADFTRSLQLQPNNSRAYLSRAAVRSAQGLIPLAFADANEALSRDPQNPQARLTRARLHELTGDYNAAIADYSAALTSGQLIGPGSEAAYIGRATAHLRAGRIADASNDCQSAVRANPNAPLAHLCLAEVHLRQNSVELAIASMNTAMFAAQTTGQPLPVIPQLPSVVLARNTAPAPAPTPVAPPAWVPTEPPPPVTPKQPEPVVVAAAPKPEPKPAAPKPPAPKPAKPEAPKVEIAKAPAPAKTAVPVKLEAKAEPKPTATQLAREIVTQKNMSLRPPTALDYEKQARELTTLHNYEDALVLINKALEQAPKSAKALNSRGFIYLLKGSYKEAIADFTEAIRLKPDYANAFHNRAVALRKLSENSAAEEDEKNATRLMASANLLE